MNKTNPDAVTTRVLPVGVNDRDMGHRQERIFAAFFEVTEICQQHDQKPRPTIQTHAETLVNEHRKVTSKELLRVLPDG